MIPFSQPFIDFPLQWALTTQNGYLANPTESPWRFSQGLQNLSGLFCCGAVAHTDPYLAR